MEFEVHTSESVPIDARENLKAVQKKYGFVPNVMGVMAEAPPLLTAYLRLNELFEETSFDAIEQQVVILTISAANRCKYCVAAHTVTAQMHKVPEDAIEAIRSGSAIPDSQLEALRQLTAELVNGRGWPRQEAVEAFVRTGYTQTQVLEVILAIGVKTLSNYTNHIAHTPLDPQFSEASWTSDPHSGR